MTLTSSESLAILVFGGDVVLGREQRDIGNAWQIGNNTSSPLWAALEAAWCRPRFAKNCQFSGSAPVIPLSKRGAGHADRASSLLFSTDRSRKY